MMNDFTQFSPLPSETFPRISGGRLGQSRHPVPGRMRDRQDRVWAFAGSVGRPLEVDEILVFPGLIYRKEL